MSEPLPVVCENCRYWAPKLSDISPIALADGIGECRRHAPRGPVTYSAPGEEKLSFVWSAFTPMVADDWCGEFAGIDGRGFASPRDIPPEETEFPF